MPHVASEVRADVLCVASEVGADMLCVASGVGADRLCVPATWKHLKANVLMISFLPVKERLEECVKCRGNFWCLSWAKPYETKLNTWNQLNLTNGAFGCLSQHDLVYLDSYTEVCTVLPMHANLIRKLFVSSLCLLYFNSRGWGNVRKGEQTHYWSKWDWQKLLFLVLPDISEGTGNSGDVERELYSHLY